MALKSSRGRTASMPVSFTASSPGIQAGPEHALLAHFIARIQEERGFFRFAVDRQNGARLDHAADVEELIALTQRLLAGALGGPLQDGDGVADLFHHARAAGGVFIGWKDVGENRLGG